MSEKQEIKSALSAQRSLWGVGLRRRGRERTGHGVVILEIAEVRAHDGVVQIRHEDVKGAVGAGQEELQTRIDLVLECVARGGLE